MFHVDEETIACEKHVALSLLASTKRQFLEQNRGIHGTGPSPNTVSSVAWKTALDSEFSDQNDRFW